MRVILRLVFRSGSLFQIGISQGDITQLEVDSIVNAANKSLLGTLLAIIVFPHLTPDRWRGRYVNLWAPNQELR